MASSPLRSTWICAGVLLVASPLLVVAAQRYPVSVQVTVCNQAQDLLLKDVGVALDGRTWKTPLHGLGSLGPGDCRSTELKIEGESSVRLVYSAAGTPYEDGQGYVEGGYQTWFTVHGPGQFSRDLKLPGLRHPPFMLGGLSALSLLAGVVYGFLGSVMALEAHLRRTASKVS